MKTNDNQLNNETAVTRYSPDKYLSESKKFKQGNPGRKPNSIGRQRAFQKKVGDGNFKTLCEFINEEGAAAAIHCMEELYQHQKYELYQKAYAAILPYVNGKKHSVSHSYEKPALTLNWSLIPIEMHAAVLKAFESDNMDASIMPIADFELNETLNPQ